MSKKHKMFSICLVIILVIVGIVGFNYANKNYTSNTETTVTPITTSPKTSGALKVSGNKLVDEKGNPVQLRGVSTHGIAWFPQYINENLFKELKTEWNVNVVRLSMYTAEYGGYSTGGDKESLKNLIRNGVKYAENQDMYVIIDWHILSDGNPNTYKEDSKEFFAQMSKEFSQNNNVIYEICNEPNGSTTWSEIKSYAEEIIPIIRSNDSDAMILVGTPNWSQYVGEALKNPITISDNIMYTLHFYAGTHKESLRNEMVSAINNGLPIFVSEFSICDASGNGAIDYNEAKKWIDTLNEHNISYVSWSLSNKSETSALISSNSNKTYGLLESDLSDTGKWLYNILTGENSPNPETNFENNINDTPSENNISENIVLNNSNVQYNAKLENSWVSNGEYFYLYRLKLKNIDSNDCSGWEITIPFNGNIKLSDNWCGNYTVNGNTLKITSVDYNGYIKAGDTIENVGFIVSGNSDLKITE